MSTQKTIKLPKTHKDLRIHHFNCIKEFDEYGMDLPAKVRFVALFINRSVNFVWSIEKDVFEDMYNHIVDLFSKMVIPINPPKEITVDGLVYELIDPKKCATSWHQDWGLFDINKDPVNIACLFYHPKGHFYGEIDDNDNLIHPVKWKYQHIKHDMELGVFMSCASFFLLNYLKSTKQLISRQIAEKKATRLLQSLPSFLLKKQYTQ